MPTGGVPSVGWDIFYNLNTAVEHQHDAHTHKDKGSKLRRLEQEENDRDPFCNAVNHAGRRFSCTLHKTFCLSSWVPSMFLLDRGFYAYYDFIATIVLFTTISCFFDVTATFSPYMYHLFVRLKGNAMKKENQRVAITKRLIKEALLKLLEKRNIRKISVCQLCQEAEINRTTFYRHYQTTTDVLQEIAFDQIGMFSEYSATAKDTHDLKEYITLLCAFLQDRKDMVKIFIQNDTEMDLKRIFQTLSQQFLGSKVILCRGKAMDRDTICLMNAFFSSGIYALIRQWLTENTSKTPEEIANLVCCSLSRDLTFQ